MAKYSNDMIFDKQNPKLLVEFDMVQFPRFLDGKTFRNKPDYAKHLIENGYAIDPNAPITSPITQTVDAVISSKTPLSEASVEKMFDAIEESAKKTFAKKTFAKGRRIRGVSGEPRKNEGES